MSINDKKTDGPSKSFMTAGPTLHYSHPNVHRCWWLALTCFILLCLFWTQIHTGALRTFGIGEINEETLWSLGRYVDGPLSIFEYPSYIFILGLLMGTITIVPILEAQLLSSRYSVLFIIAVAFIAKLPFLALTLTLSCIAVASRPLRFRSRFVSVVLCTMPQMVYWVVCGGIKTIDPVKLGYSYAPWLVAWIAAMCIAGIVIGVGHWKDYKPGMIWLVTLLSLCGGYFSFKTTIGFAEADYQIYVKQNNPEELEEFHNHSIAELLDQTVKDERIRSYLTASFYSDEPILLRTELKRETQRMLRSNHWPEWFAGILPEKFDYETKRKNLLQQYDYFLNRHPNSKRMPIALYYKGILRELSPDIRAIGQKDLLSFYSDYPHREVLPTWTRLYKDFPDSKESVEARWRIAMHRAGKADFATAEQLCDEALQIAADFTAADAEPSMNEPGPELIFRKPQDTAITNLKLQNLTDRLFELKKLMSSENHDGTTKSKERLAKLIILNPYENDYNDQLEMLLEQTTVNDRLRDNILLRKILLIEDSLLRERSLEDMIAKYSDTDAAQKALYELGKLQVHLWRNTNQYNVEQRDALLKEAKITLDELLTKFPESIYAKRTKNIIEGLPSK